MGYCPITLLWLLNITSVHGVSIYEIFKDLILHRGLLRRTCSPELQVWRWVLCRVACAGCSIRLGLVAILFGAHQVRCMAES